MNFLNDYTVTSWLCSFFLPHIADTSSFIFNQYKDIGFLIAIIGLLGFLFGAGQVYYAKFKRKGAVTGGIYNYIRHPQYTSLAMCSFGLLMVWPRYLVLVMFITMLFAYYFLAKAEENECEEKFGQDYLDFKNRTNRFLPFNIPLLNKLPALPQNRIKRYALIFGLYLAAIFTGVFAGDTLNRVSLDTLFVSYSKDAATISIIELKQDVLEDIRQIALKDPEVQSRLAAVGYGTGAKFLNYVMPAEWFFADIPMSRGRYVDGHIEPENWDRNLYKIIFTKVHLKSDKDVQGKALIMNTAKRIPIIDVKVDLAKRAVTGIETPPATVRWGDIPTPVY